jgi:hypothetical protein
MWKTGIDECRTSVEFINGTTEANGNVGVVISSGSSRAVIKLAVEGATRGIFSRNQGLGGREKFRDYTWPRTAAAAEPR